MFNLNACLKPLPTKCEHRRTDSSGTPALEEFKSSRRWKLKYDSGPIGYHTDSMFEHKVH